MNRAQVSLIFEDDELFTNLVLGLKQSRDLSPFIIRCMSAYYYNPEVRALIDGHVDEEPTEEVDIQEQLNSIRNSLLMQAVFAEEGLQTMESGTSEMEDILKYSSDRVKEYEQAQTQAGGSENTESSDDKLPLQIGKNAEDIDKLIDEKLDAKIQALVDSLDKKFQPIFDLLQNGVNLGAEEVKQPYEVESEKSVADETSSLDSKSDTVKPPIVEEQKTDEAQADDGTDGLLALLDSM